MVKIDDKVLWRPNPDTQDETIDAFGLEDDFFDNIFTVTGVYGTSVLIKCGNFSGPAELCDLTKIGDK